MKKLRNVIVISILAIYLLVVLGLTSDESGNRICNTIHIHIMDSLENRFLAEEDILDIIQKKGGQILGYPVGSINIKAMEDQLMFNPYIKNAEVFICGDGSLHVDIEQRKPIMRVIDQNRNSYYVASDGVVMPLSEKYSARVLVANGYLMNSSNFRNILTNADNREEEMLYMLYRIAQYIDQTVFWKAQIEQIYVDRDGEIELIPRVGAHIIEFGKPVDFENKFRNLMAFYEQGLKETGWNKYEKISLKYKGQVVCTLR